jgi:hypothetical protein
MEVWMTGAGIMSRSFAILTIAALSLSAPINAGALVVADQSEDSLELVTVPVEAPRPVCKKETATFALNVAATGGMPDTEPGATEARVTGCCWVQWMGIWFCLQC